MRIREKKHRLDSSEYVGRIEVVFTTCVQSRRPILTKHEIVAPLVEILGKQAARKDCTVPVYCFMPNHLHVMVRGETESADTYAAMVAFKIQSGYWFAGHLRGIA